MHTSQSPLNFASKRRLMRPILPGVQANLTPSNSAFIVPPIIFSVNPEKLPSDTKRRNGWKNLGGEVATCNWGNALVRIQVQNSRGKKDPVVQLGFVSKFHDKNGTKASLTIRMPLSKFSDIVDRQIVHNSKSLTARYNLDKGVIKGLIKSKTPAADITNFLLPWILPGKFAQEKQAIFAAKYNANGKLAVILNPIIKKLFNCPDKDVEFSTSGNYCLDSSLTEEADQHLYAPKNLFMPAGLKKADSACEVSPKPPPLAASYKAVVAPNLPPISETTKSNVPMMKNNSLVDDLGASLHVLSWPMVSFWMTLSRWSSTIFARFRARDSEILVAESEASLGSFGGIVGARSGPESAKKAKYPPGSWQAENDRRKALRIAEELLAKKPRAQKAKIVTNKEIDLLSSKEVKETEAEKTQAVLDRCLKRMVDEGQTVNFKNTGLNKRFEEIRKESMGTSAKKSSSTQTPRNHSTNNKVRSDTSTSPISVQTCILQHQSLINPNETTQLSVEYSTASPDSAIITLRRSETSEKGKLKFKLDLELTAEERRKLHEAKGDAAQARYLAEVKLFPSLCGQKASEPILSEHAEAFSGLRVLLDKPSTTILDLNGLEVRRSSVSAQGIDRSSVAGDFSCELAAVRKFTSKP